MLKNNPKLSRDKLEELSRRMDAGVLDCLIQGYEPVMESSSLPDPDDRHDLAAAVAGRVDVIVTANLKDFPARILRTYDIEAVHRDAFFCQQMDLDLEAVLSCLKSQRNMYSRPACAPEEFLGFLGKHMPRAVARLRPFTAVI